MNQWLRLIGLLGIMGLVASPVNGAGQASPATGYDIHVQVPHMMPDGTVWQWPGATASLVTALPMR